MDIKAFSIKIDKEEATKLAESRGKWLRRLLCGGKTISEVRLHFVECKLITYEITHRPNFLEKFIFRKSQEKKQKITMLADGTNGSVAWVDSMPGMVMLDNVAESQVQYVEKDDEYIINKGRGIALKVVHRHAGGIPEIKMLSIDSVFRPYWIAFFDEVIEGKKVHYCPVAADGCGMHRTI
ncbi:hypothetical protein SPSIL_002370 [Sporomusa silvacetica DSM 10669]|uniref:Uncharacterized protein n=1 Tax=Sporomusa silvacetica DSM 10669 TaxID=1123289 RepID=A0ABZ3IEP0_9FIRM|nr:hypothetical protein [Sporomusa silvacetica]OZC17861.1 hypothetical protein SPSIL_30010 [Sporomusa silvacetica DSM 10669]